MYRFLPALGLLAGCAGPVAVAGPDHPASASAPTAPLVVDATALAPVVPPDLPAPLRPAARADSAHGPMHGPAHGPSRRDSSHHEHSGHAGHGHAGGTR